jgi:transposase
MARYTNEMRERAVRMVAEVRPEHPHETAAPSVIRLPIGL